MNKLKLVPVLVLTVLVVLVVSCKKDSDKTADGGTGNTDFQVYVIDSTSQPVSGSNVGIYGSQSDRDAGTNPIKFGVTGGKGFVYFSELSSMVYYISVSKDYGSGVIKKKNADSGVPIKEKQQTAVTVVLQ